ncbi:hypothetical protein BO99DRAFT_415046 [Aspergillus violaceofuscus CBS 115571]|uniref:Uncharacterized protein n=1 Tax=Aspergillus violaceofuscus (strain CBS 115571) TaxID=1450538 RepID=A0A2V5GY81_ASPV1|nr:hypothetical protein BO99DRAFT_415046 [Aspergillus violaceofuscus CBS 115571]
MTCYSTHLSMPLPPKPSTTVTGHLWRYRYIPSFRPPSQETTNEPTKNNAYRKQLLQSTPPHPPHRETYHTPQLPERTLPLCTEATHPKSPQNQPTMALSEAFIPHAFDKPFKSLCLNPMMTRRPLGSISLCRGVKWHLSTADQMRGGNRGGGGGRGGFNYQNNRGGGRGGGFNNQGGRGGFNNNNNNNNTNRNNNSGRGGFNNNYNNNQSGRGGFNNQNNNNNRGGRGANNNRGGRGGGFFNNNNNGNNWNNNNNNNNNNSNGKNGKKNKNVNWYHPLLDPYDFEDDSARLLQGWGFDGSKVPEPEDIEMTDAPPLEDPESDDDIMMGGVSDGEDSDTSMGGWSDSESDSDTSVGEQSDWGAQGRGPWNSDISMRSWTGSDPDTSVGEQPARAAQGRRLSDSNISMRSWSDSDSDTSFGDRPDSVTSVNDEQSDPDDAEGVRFE